MSTDRHINFKILRDRILSGGNKPSATADGSDSLRDPKSYWRSLDELADSPAFEELVIGRLSIGCRNPTKM